VPRGTRVLPESSPTAPTGLSPSPVGLSRPLRNCQRNSLTEAPQPRWSSPHRFRLLPVRSPLLGESLLLSSPPGTKMFQFPGCPPHRLSLQRWVTRHYSGQVPPFGNPRILAPLPLPWEYRCCARPSSALCPKASTRRPS